MFYFGIQPAGYEEAQADTWNTWPLQVSHRIAPAEVPDDSCP